LDFGETVEQCAARELLEETGLELEDIKAGPYTNNFFEFEQKHYVTLFVVSHCRKGEPAILEPDKCSRWEWFRWSELPTPLFPPLQTLFDTGFAPGNAS
jgi:8-oxo-dGTP diphosphatase